MIETYQRFHTLYQGFGAVDFYSWLPAPRLPAPIAQNIAGSRLPGSRLPSKSVRGSKSFKKIYIIERASYIMS